MAAIGPIFDKPVHPPNWQRPAWGQPGYLDYRVTGTFDGIDLVNGGTHQATDVGNGDVGHPVVSPGNIRARGLRNYSRIAPLATDALGVEFDMGEGVRIEVWHLSDTLLVADLNSAPGVTTVGPWQEVTAGQTVARTGNSGAQVGGKAMPAHSHVVGERNGVRFDMQPYLIKPASIGGVVQEEEVDFSKLSHQQPKVVKIRPGAILYKQPVGLVKHHIVGSDGKDLQGFEAELLSGHPDGRMLGRRRGVGSSWWVDSSGYFPESEVPYKRAVYP